MLEVTRTRVRRRQAESPSRRGGPSLRLRKLSSACSTSAYLALCAGSSAPARRRSNSSIVNQAKGREAEHLRSPRRSPTTSLREAAAAASGWGLSDLSCTSPGHPPGARLAKEAQV